MIKYKWWFSLFVSVIIDLKIKELDQKYDYIVPDELKELVEIGQRVVVPFGNMERLGYVVDILDDSLIASKPILEIVDITPIISDVVWFLR